MIPTELPQRSDQESRSAVFDSALTGVGVSTTAARGNGIRCTTTAARMGAPFSTDWTSAECNSDCRQTRRRPQTGRSQVGRDYFT